MFSPPLKKSIVFLKYALKMDLVKGAWFDFYKFPKVRKGQILRSTPNTAPLICGAYNTQPEGLLTTGYYYPRFYMGLPEGEKKELGEVLSCGICFDGRYYAVSGRCTVDRKNFICYDVVTGT